jgi:hypothetical protein
MNLFIKERKKNILHFQVITSIEYNHLLFPFSFENVRFDQVQVNLYLLANHLQHDLHHDFQFQIELYLPTDLLTKKRKIIFENFVPNVQIIPGHFVSPFPLDHEQHIPELTQDLVEYQQLILLVDLKKVLDDQILIVSLCTHIECPLLM